MHGHDNRHDINWWWLWAILCCFNHHCANQQKTYSMRVVFGFGCWSVVGAPDRQMTAASLYCEWSKIAVSDKHIAAVCDLDSCSISLVKNSLVLVGGCRRTSADRPAPASPDCSSSSSSCDLESLPPPYHRAGHTNTHTHAQYDVIRTRCSDHEPVV